MKVRLLLILLLTLTISYGEISIYKIWTPYDPNLVPIMYIDINEPVLYIGIVNKDEYAHNVVVKAELNGETFTTVPIYLPPNDHMEKIVELRIPVYDDKVHNVKVSLIENGKEIVSKNIPIKCYFPIDVKNVSCQDCCEYKDGEVCYSNWFYVVLKSNPLAQSDYNAKVWINVKSGNTILYDGKKDAKTVYIPWGNEVKLSFKIPKISLNNNDKFTIETYVVVMNVTHSVEGYEKTELKRDENGIYHKYNSYKKYFYFPVIIKNIDVYNKIDRDNVDLVKKFYSNVLDEELEEIINKRNYPIYGEIPRVYVKDETTLSFINVTLENRYNKDVIVKFIWEYGNNSYYKTIKINKNSDTSFILPIYSKPGNVNIKFSVNPIEVNSYIYNTSYTLNVNPKLIAPVIIKKIILPLDQSINEDVNGTVLVGKWYNITLIIKNKYYKPLSGYIEISDNFEKGVVNYTKRVEFNISAYGVKKIKIPIIFYREVNGDLKVTLKTKNGVKDDCRIIHFYAYLPIEVKEVKYNNSILHKISVVGNGGIYTYNPIAGYNNTCIVRLKNKLNKNISCKVWVEVYNKNGKLEAKSDIKFVKFKPDEEKTLKFNLYFNEGFEGYTLIHAVPMNLENVDVIFTQGLNYHLVQIPKYYEVGRYSHLSLLGLKVSTASHEITRVVSPISIKSLKFENNKIIAEIESNSFPTNLDVNYWINVNNYKSEKYSTNLPPKSSKVVEIPISLTSGNYTIEFCAEVDNFLSIDGKKCPILIKKYLNISILENKSSIASNQVKINGSYQNNITKINISSYKKDKNNKEIKNITNLTSKKSETSIIDAILSPIKVVIVKILEILPI
ncbi:hypothetical protein J422_05808 [Methanocaldococcus villosus KIN24-T80]|uniref:Uncharacterized protein n=1 Tax=Methanocaldococcus villosus KIN24-T80 TaxID=1069083 RepID=N6VXG9_9EURY|nr:hypothetical protein [Methanocaldococcus villosus]ENN95827.1 hypothetical protein J422_05808 [Methanocaldococcus villosus KIN24-T80]